MNYSQTIMIATIMREKGETGVQTYVNVFNNYLLNQGVKASIITPFFFDKWLVFPVFGVRKIIDKLSGELSVWWYRHWHYVFLKQVLIKILAEQAQKGVPVVVYAQCPLSAKAALEARATDNQKVAMVVHFNISQADEWAAKGKIRQGGWVYNKIIYLEKQVIQRLDSIVYLSKFMKQTIENRITENAQLKSIVLPNFISIPPQNQLESIKCSLINIGTLEKRKNQSYLLQVLAEAKKRGKCYSLTLVGDGSDRKKLELLTQSLDIANQVNFMGFMENAAQLLYTHRVYVHSALIENFPIALLEALACSLPILAGAVGGIPEIFSDGVEGFYWPLDDPAAGSEKLIALMEDIETYNKLAKAAQVKFSGNFETNVVASRLLSFLCNE